MMGAVSDLTAWTARLSNPKWSRSAGYAILEVEGRQVAILRVQLQDAKLAELAPYFPIQLLPTRVSYLPQTVQEALNLPAQAELLVEAMLPEVLGPIPLAQWPLTADEAETLARANRSGGALVIQLNPSKRRAAPLHHIFSPYWLDWAGWVGFARRALEGTPLPNAATLRYMSYELTQRSADAPTGLHTAQAYLLSAAGTAWDAAGACQDELALSLNEKGLPTIGAQEALVLLGQLLHAHGDRDEGFAALSLALWLNPNHQAANTEILPLLEEEAHVVEILARLGRLPRRVPNYSDLIHQGAAQTKLAQGTLESKIEAALKEPALTMFARRPSWVTEAELPGWLNALGL